MFYFNFIIDTLRVSTEKMCAVHVGRCICNGYVRHAWRRKHRCSDDLAITTVGRDAKIRRRDTARLHPAVLLGNGAIFSDPIPSVSRHHVATASVHRQPHGYRRVAGARSAQILVQDTRQSRRRARENTNRTRRGRPTGIRGRSERVNRDRYRARLREDVIDLHLAWREFESVGCGLRILSIPAMCSRNANCAQRSAKSTLRLEFHPRWCIFGVTRAETWRDIEFPGSIIAVVDSGGGIIIFPRGPTHRENCFRDLILFPFGIRNWIRTIDSDPSATLAVFYDFFSLLPRYRYRREKNI